MSDSNQTQHQDSTVERLEVLVDRVAAPVASAPLILAIEAFDVWRAFTTGETEPRHSKAVAVSRWLGSVVLPNRERIL